MAIRTDITDRKRAEQALLESEKRDMVSGYNLGANSYLQKPVDFNESRTMMKLAGRYWMVVNRPPLGNGGGHASEQVL